MSQPQQTTVRNRLLKAFSAEDFALLQPHLEMVATELKQVLVKLHEPVRHLYFPEVGFNSMTTSGSEGRVEIGLIGREGLVGAIPVLLGSDRSPHLCFVQNPGEMLRIETAALSAAVHESASLYRLLLCSAQVLFTQTAQTAFINAIQILDTRLARWLLMCHDRVDGDELQITHEFLSQMLGTTRSSTTLAVQGLEGHRLIQARRGRITILDRETMETVADDGYGLPEVEFVRLMPRYFFNIRYCPGPEGLAEDHEGDELPDVNAAREHALAQARDMAAKTRMDLVRDWMRCALEIVDENRQPVLTVPFSDLVSGMEDWD